MNLNACCRAQFLQVGAKSITINLNQLIRTHGWQSLKAICRFIFLQQFVILQIRSWIISSADRLDIHVLNQIARLKVISLQQCISLFPDLRRVFQRQFIINMEETLQFKVRPFIQWIAISILNCFGPFQKLLIFIAIPGNVLLISTVSPHQAPLVMIAIVVLIDPDPGQIRIVFVFIDFNRIKVTMIVNNRHFSRVFMKQFLSRFITQ